MEHGQIKSWLSKERAANGGVVHKERRLMARPTKVGTRLGAAH